MELEQLLEARRDLPALQFPASDDLSLDEHEPHHGPERRRLKPAFTWLFALAGNATFTLLSRKTETRYTYRVRKSEDGRVHFVSVMFGPDNEGDFAYIGIIRDDRFMHGRKSKLVEDDKRVMAFRWFWRALVSHRIPEALEVWHEGACGRCGRKLTVPESIERGIGPECWKHFGD